MRSKVAARVGSLGVVLVTVLAGISSQGVHAESGAAPAFTQTPSNIVLILTDDQRADTLRYMPNVRRLLARRGITFTSGYVVNPVCCPSRASILTGNYSHTTRVYTNRPHRPFGGFPAFEDGSTIATWLDAAGYRTGLFGKYLNGYEGQYVPPGWDRWFATFNSGGFYDYQASSDGELVTFGDDRSDYGMTVLRRRVVSFIRHTDPATPLFAYLAPHAPHRPATPAPGDGRLFSSLSPYRPASFDEANLADKPDYIASRGHLSSAQEAKVDRFRLAQLRALQGVDAAVARIVDALRDTGRLQDTMIVFTSDNGIEWGEHGWTSKEVPYEESIRVPFVVRYDPEMSEARTDRRDLVLNIDLAPTFAAVAGVQTPDTDGRSMVPLFGSRSATWRHSFLIEHLDAVDRGVPTFCAVHTERYMFVRYVTGEEELYDLARDPDQMVSRSRSNRYAGRRETLLTKLGTLCDPVPPGFSF